VTGALDPARIENAIEALLGERRADASICPSEVARRLSPDDWRALMPLVRDVAFAMARAGRIRITRRGVAIDPDRPVRGPIRLARR
jgi:uncharacterized protein with von Willebrand factor type A (vWA) domain